VNFLVTTFFRNQFEKKLSVEGHFDISLHTRVQYVAPMHGPVVILFRTKYMVQILEHLYV